MSNRVIGLGGRLRAGKDAVADHLVAEYGFHKIGMSDALHEAMLAIDPFVPINTTSDAFSIGEHGLFARYSTIIRESGYVEAKKNPEVRRLLQHLGTEVGRDMIGENTWANITARKIDDFLYADTPVVVTGIRFPNELTMVHQFAGRTVWVERPSEYAQGGAGSHSSENGVDPTQFDRILLNDGTLEDLYAKVEGLL